jgi:hypothetical protein
MRENDNWPEPVPVGSGEVLAAALAAQDAVPARQGRPRLSPGKPTLETFAYEGVIEMLQFKAGLSDVVPDDHVQRREIHVVDATGTDNIFVVDPAITVQLVTCARTDGGQGMAFVVDYDEANNASTPAVPITFPTYPPIPPDTTGPTQPTILSFDFVAEIPDEPQPQPQGESASGQARAIARGKVQRTIRKDMRQRRA